MMNNRNKMQQYAAVGVQTSIMDADSHRLIQLLFQGAHESISKAVGSIERNDIEQRNAAINKIIKIVGGLREFLDFEKGGDLSQNLAQLYDYIVNRLFEANVLNSAEYVLECGALLKEVSGAWDQIRSEVVPAQESAVSAP